MACVTWKHSVHPRTVQVRGLRDSASKIPHTTLFQSVPYCSRLGHVIQAIHSSSRLLLMCVVGVMLVVEITNDVLFRVEKVSHRMPESDMNLPLERRDESQMTREITGGLIQRACTDNPVQQNGVIQCGFLNDFVYLVRS